MREPGKGKKSEEDRIVVRFSEQELRQLKAKRNALDVKWQAVGWKLWMDWLKSGETAIAPERESGYNAASTTPSVAEWVSLFEAILMSGHQVAITALTHNVIAFAELVHADKEGKVEGYKVPPIGKGPNTERIRGLLYRYLHPEKRREENS